MHPFRTLELPAVSSSADPSWPLLGSVFTETAVVSPAVPSALRPLPTRIVSAQEWDALVDGHWIPYNNSRLAPTCINRVTQTPATNPMKCPVAYLPASKSGLPDVVGLNVDNPGEINLA